ncbi:MAG TPA: hypothetical protein VFU78_11395 [Thermomicrobiales bacterium]|nr:hypothetical protein [Thermomicrobiales bacterium]
MTFSNSAAPAPSASLLALYRAEALLLASDLHSLHAAVPAFVPLPCQQQWVAPETLAAQLLAVAFWNLHDGGDLTLVCQGTATIGITGARPAARAGLEGLLLRRLTRSALAPQDVGSAILFLFSGKSAAGATLVLQTVLDDAVTRGYYTRLTPAAPAPDDVFACGDSRYVPDCARLAALADAGATFVARRRQFGRDDARLQREPGFACARALSEAPAPPPDTDWGQLASDGAAVVIGTYYPGLNQSRPGLLELILNLLSRR